MSKFLLMSTNKFKVRVYQHICQQLGHELEVAKGLPEVEEPYDSLYLNALGKLESGIKNYDGEYDYAIVDDSGLFIPSMGGYPGVHTKRETERFERINGAGTGINSTINFIIKQAGGEKAKLQSSIIIYDRKTGRKCSMPAQTYGVLPTEAFQYEKGSTKPWTEYLLRNRKGGYSSLAFRDARMNAVGDILQQLSAV